MKNNNSIDAGRLTERITIQKPDRTTQPSGQLNTADEHWLDVATVWAEVKCIRVSTEEDAGIIQHGSEYRFYIRWRNDIRAEMRIVWNDGGRVRVFELTGPPADWKGRRVGLTLVGRELVDDA